MADLSSFVNIEIRSSSAKKGSEEVVASLNKVERAEKTTEKQTKKTNESFDDLGKKTKKASGGVSSLGSATQQLSKTFASLPVTPVATIAAITAASVKAIKVLAEFEQSVANLSAITGATGKNLEFLSDSARELGKTTTLSASQVAKAFELVASAKPDLLESADALKAVTKETITLAEAAGIDLPTAAKSLGNALNQFGEGADQASRFINVLAAGSKFGASQIADTAQALKVSGVSAKGASVSFETLNASVQTLSTVGVEGAQAGTALRNIILKLEKEAIAGAIPSVDGFANALENLGKKNLSTAEMTKLFGLENVNAADALIQNVDAMRKLENQITGTNVAQEQADTRTATMSASFAKLGSAAEELALVLGGDTGLGALVKLLTDGLTALVLGTAHAAGGFIDLVKFISETTGHAALLRAEFAFISEVSTDLANNFQQGIITVVGILAESFITLAQIITTLPVYAFEVLRNIVGETANAMLSAAIAILEFKGGSEGLVETLENMKVVQDPVIEKMAAFHERFAEARAGVDDFVGSTIEYIEYTQSAASATDTLTESTVALSESKALLSEGTVSVLANLQEEFDALQRNAVQQEIYLAAKEAGVDLATTEGELIAEKVKLLVVERKRVKDLAADEAKAAKAKKKFLDDGGEAGKMLSDFKQISSVTNDITDSFGENEKARKALFIINKTMAIAEIGLSVQKIAASNAETATEVANGAVKQSSNALTAITSAFSAPFPLNFAAGAAMIAIMGSLLGGKSGGGGSVSGPTAQELQGTGTVLGSNEKSESLSNSFDRFEDISIDQLAELRSIRDGINALAGGTDQLTKSLSGATGFDGIKALNLQNSTIGQLSSGADSGARVIANWTNEVKNNKDLVEPFQQSVQKQVAALFGNITDAVGASIEFLGLETLSAVDDFQVKVGRIDLKGLSGDEIQKELEAVFGSQADLLVGALIPSMAEYQQVGEGLFDTLTRVSLEQAIFNDSVEAMGISLSGLSQMIKIDIAQSIIDFAGGAEKFSDLTSSFLDEFFTEEEKIARLTKSTTEALDGLGVSMFDSRDQFKEMIAAIDVTTESGQKLFAGLLELNPALDEIFDSMEQGIESAAEALAAQQSSLESITDSAFNVLKKSISAEKDSLKKIFDADVKSLKTRVDSVTSSVKSLEGLSGSVEKAISSLNTQSKTNELSSRRNAQAQIDAAIAISRAGGSLTGIDLEDSLSVVSKPSADLFGSFTDYMRDFQKTNNSLSELNEEAQKQITVEQMTLDVLNAQIDADTLRFESQMSALDQQIEAAQEQINLLRGIDDTLVSIQSASGSLTKAIGGEAGGKASSQSDPIESLYQNILGRASDAEGKKFWEDQLASGSSLAQISNAIATSPEALGIPAFASGGYHSGGARMVGEAGTEIEVTGSSKIISNSEIARRISGDNEALLLEIRDEIRRGNFAIARNTLRTYNLMDEWDANGIPEEREQ